VEHPVTEMVTGLDLVELMIRVAAGQTLPIGQDDVRLEGWAIEARIYAEDPYRNFLPSIGRLVRYAPPIEDEGVRIDTGVYEGAEISMFYDPMIAKLVAHGETRDEAAERVLHALDGFTIEGLNHNIPFLAALMHHPRFLGGVLTTNFIAEEYPEGFAGAPIDADDLAAFIAVAAAMLLEKRSRDSLAGGPAVVPRPEPEVFDWTVVLGDDHVDVTVDGEPGDCTVRFALGEETVAVPVVSAWRPGQALFEGEVAGAQLRVQVRPWRSGWALSRAGMTVQAMVVARRTAELMRRMPKKVPPDFSKFVLSPMPGQLVSVAVAEGQEVKAGEEVAVVEAMKMENLLRAERDGVVKTIHAAAGDALAVDQAIVEFE
jgi:propionyl-CoA carboxylase alpha chain